MTNDDLAAIARQREVWIAAINDGTPDGFVSVLAADAVWLPAMRPAISGKAQIRDWLEKPFAEFDYDYSVSDVRVRLAGDWAVERANFRTEATTRSGQEAPIHEGEYTIIWSRSSNGEWIIDRYIDHTPETS